MAGDIDVNALVLDPQCFDHSFKHPFEPIRESVKRDQPDYLQRCYSNVCRTSQEIYNFLFESIKSKRCDGKHNCRDVKKRFVQDFCRLYIPAANLLAYEGAGGLL